MANRSYLYARLPGVQHDLRDLSEWKSAAPPLHLLLVGTHCRPCPSKIWNADGIALEGEAGPARELTRRFLDWLEPQCSEPAGFAKEKAEALACLEGAAGADAYHLEVGEILELEALELDGMPARVHQLAADAAILTQEVARLLDTPGATLADSTNAYLVQVRADWQTHLGLFFPGILYHHFTAEPNAPEQPAAAAAAVAPEHAVLTRHAARLSLFEQERVFALQEDGLEITEPPGSQTNSLALADVAAVRLAWAGTDRNPHRHLCILRTRTGQRFTFSNQHYLSPGTFEERAATYNPLVRALLRRLAAQVPGCRFERGMSRLGWWAMQAAWIALSLLGVGIGLVDGNLGWGGNALIWIGLIIGIFLNLIFAVNRPRPFDPLQPALLP